MATSTVSSWTIIFDGVNLSGLEGGLADGDAVILSAPEAKPAKIIVGAQGDSMVTSDTQSYVRNFKIRTIYGLKAYTELQTRALASQNKLAQQGSYPTYEATIAKSVQTAPGVFSLTQYSCSSVAFVDFPEDTVKNVNADEKQLIMEFEFSGVVIPNLA